MLICAVSACTPQASPALQAIDLTTPEVETPTPDLSQPLSRPQYNPGELVDYIAQSGDTLPALATRFNTTEAEIRSANPIIPQDATTMPPGFPMKIPIYYLPLWGSAYPIIPDAAFVNGPAQIGFNTADFINAHEGWLKDYTESLTAGRQTAAQIIDLVAKNFSVSPRMLIALIEYQSQGLSNPKNPSAKYPLGYESRNYQGLYLQLVWTANTLNNGYYAWRRGSLTSFDLADGKLVRPDPWQNAASVSLQLFFALIHDPDQYNVSVGAIGFAQTYRDLFGDPFTGDLTILPGSLTQPTLTLPFAVGESWNFTGGPHTGWGKGEPFAAIDFAPSGVSECNATNQFVIAIADGVIARSDPGELILDLDRDGDERTGWVIYYLHLAASYMPETGSIIRAGDRLGHPSCEGGEATGTHVHIARKYNGEWILADGTLAFNLDGWIARDGERAYAGTLTRLSRTVIASTTSEGFSLIER